MKPYTPNFSDPRVQRMLKRAMIFAAKNLDANTPKQIARKTLDLQMGYSGHNLPDWIRETLLINHSQHWNGLKGICKEWRLNKEGFDKIYQILLDHNVIVDLEIQQKS